MSTTVDVAANVSEVQSRIADAASRAGRDPASVLLVAVSKTYSLDHVRAAYDAGVRHFGENRVEEAGNKITATRTTLPADVIWHMIGHIQSRKCAEVAELFEWTHSVERLKIARRLSDALIGAEHTLNVLLEINISGEESKYGYPLAGWPVHQHSFDALCAELTAIQALPGIQIQGLMTMAPFSDVPEDARPVFRRLRALQSALRDQFPQLPLPHLSMGMSGDYLVAVEEGATMVRVGTAIFGAREV